MPEEIASAALSQLRSRAFGGIDERRALLCGKVFEHRKRWIEDRLKMLAPCFAVSVCSSAIMDHHLHVLLRLDPQEADAWSAEEVIRRWTIAYPPRPL